MGEEQILTRSDGHDDDWTVEATVPESERLVWWWLSFGAGVEVLAPLELRKRVIAELCASVEYYK